MSLPEEYCGDEMPAGHHRAFHLWGLDGNSQAGAMQGPGTSGDSVSAAALRGTVTQCLSASAARAEQVVWDQ